MKYKDIISVTLTLITMVLLAVFIVSAFTSQAWAEDSRCWVSENHYAEIAVVCSVDEENNTVSLAIPFGREIHQFSWHGIEDMAIGDICGIVVYDNETAGIADDVVSSITYVIHNRYLGDDILA